MQEIDWFENNLVSSTSMTSIQTFIKVGLVKPRRKCVLIVTTGHAGYRRRSRDSRFVRYDVTPISQYQYGYRARATLLWPKLPYLSQCIPTWLANWYVPCARSMTRFQPALTFPSQLSFRRFVEVSTPMDYGLPYEDLTLDTSDGVRIKAYLLLQRRYLPGDHADGKPLVSEEDVAEADRKVWNLDVTFTSCRQTTRVPCRWTIRLTTMIPFLVVCQHTSYSTYVPWQWGEHWPPSAACPNTLFQDSMQCHFAIVQGVSSCC